MDTTLTAIMKESINREIKWTNKFKDAARTKKALESSSPTATAAALSLEPRDKQSSALNYFDQKLGIKANPHINTAYSKTASQRDMLVYGVSSEEEGRRAYLKQRHRQNGPHVTFGRQVLSSHEVGWTAKSVTTHQSSPFAHRPLVKSQFYRTNGVGSISAPTL